LNSDTDNPEIPTDFIKAIEFLWKKEPAIKKVFERKNEYNLSKYLLIIIYYYL